MAISVRNRHFGRKAALLLLSLATLVAVGCSLLPTEELGTLVLSFSPRLVTQTIEPPLDMVPSHYDVRGSGPGGAAFEQLGVTSQTVVQASLVPGTWTISVDAYNADPTPTLIGAGELVATIESGSVLSIPIVVGPVTGTGTLDLDITWPQGVLSSPSVSATLVPLGETPDQDLHSIDFTVAGEAATFVDPVGQCILRAGLRFFKAQKPLWSAQGPQC